jgi:outer membrane lipoprotein-sorting protein
MSLDSGGTMNRRHFLGTLAAVALAPLPALAQPIPLNRISNFFNRLETLEARFTQANPDGTRSTGTLYIRRPGRARFEYDPPDNTLVMAGGGQLAIVDGKSNIRRPEQYPLRQTPLNVILERTVDLAQSGVVVGHSGTADATIVVARDPARPEIGRIALVFAENPLRMTGWVTEDASGGSTEVRLSDPRIGHDIPAGLFSIQNEIAARGR